MTWTALPGSVRHHPAAGCRATALLAMRMGSLAAWTEPCAHLKNTLQKDAGILRCCNLAQLIVHLEVWNTAQSALCTHAAGCSSSNSSSSSSWGAH